MDKQRLLYLLDRHAEANASEAEEAELDQWLAELSNQSEDFLFGEQERAQMTEEMLARLHAQMSPKHLSTGIVRKIAVWKWVAAASVLLVLISGYIWQRSHTNSEVVLVKSQEKDIAPGGNHAVLTLANGQKIVLDSASNGQLSSQPGTTVIKLDSGIISYAGGNTTVSTQYNTLETPKGGQYELILPDKTHVWLNAASRIKFPIQFAKEAREVEVLGEAYFEVTHNPKKPFLVNTSWQTIKVLGTRFNISAYAEDKMEKTTLLEGKVQVINTTGKTAVLVPGKQVANNSNALTITTPDDLAAVTAWKNGLISFSGVEVPLLLRQLSRWYDITIIYKGKVPEGTLSGDISRYTSLSNVIKILRMNGIECQLQNRNLIVN